MTDLPLNPGGAPAGGISERQRQASQSLSYHATFNHPPSSGANAPPSPSKGKAFQRLCEHSDSIVTFVRLFVLRFVSVENETIEVLQKAFPFEGEGGAVAPDEGGPVSGYFPDAGIPIPQTPHGYTSHSTHSKSTPAPIDASSWGSQGASPKEAPWAGLGAAPQGLSPKVL